MPGTHAFDGNILRLTFERDTTLVEVKQVLEAALADPACPERPHLLSDMRLSTSVAQLPMDGMRDAVAIFGAEASRLARRCATLTATKVQFGMMRMAQAFAEPYGFEFQVFDDEADAVAWLRDG